MNPQQTVLDLACGNWYTQSLATICNLQIPDLIPENICIDVSILAEETNTNEEALFRLLRALASKGVFIQYGKSFAHSDASLLLMSNNPSCLASYCVMRGQEYQYRSWINLEYSIRTGKSAIHKTMGMSMFEYFDKYPKERIHFDRAMASITKHVGQELVLLSHTENLFPDNALLVDIGGGNGELMKHLVEVSPTVVGFVLDIKGHKQDIMMDHPRISFLQGSFFDKESIPTIGNVYILKYILHDWGNEECIQILRNIKRVLPIGSKLFIIEALLNDQDSDYHKMLDLQMLVCLADGARERTKQEYEDLLHKGGFQMERVIPLKTLGLSLMIAS